jgi:hypothetical protein
MEAAMRKLSFTWIGAAVLGVGGVALAPTNPGLATYQEQVLVSVAQERHSASDALLASILQSLPMPASPDPRDPSGLVSLLLNRTKRENYVLLSVYSTEFDFCQNMSRAASKTLGIAGRFYTVDLGKCPEEKI